MIALTEVPATAQTATFYSSGHHGRTTASGARFSQHQHVAAHPYLPFGTRVKVINPKTGKSVIVRIVDRCRCSIDLSQAAYRQIGSLRGGRVPVRIRVLR
ncbi:septal ring lytic transglycosylase RlpA family protein [Gloeothece verrucosa]|nr:septal ring lytic transglycosylase RlpA family protein [Gloeothece verrucosa]